MDAHIDPVSSGYREQYQPQRYADVALLRAAIEAYDAEQLVEQAQFFATAARGRPKVRQEASLSTHFRYLGQAYRLSVSRLDSQHYRVTIDRHRIDVRVARLGQSECRTECLGRLHQVIVVRQEPDYDVEVDGISHRLIREDGGMVRSPSPAVVVSVHVAPGDFIEAGTRLVVLETMKVEMTISAPFSGRVARLFVTSNVYVEAGAPLVQLESRGWDNEPVAAERVQFGDAEYQVAATREDPQLRCRQILEALHSQMLGYDVDPADSKRLLSEQKAVYRLLAPDDQELQRGEDEILSIFADICSLFRRELDPVEAGLHDEQVHSAEQDLHTYLRFRAARLEQLPPVFLQNLRRALAHYGVASLEPSSRLDESLLAIYKSHQRVNSQLPAIIAMLERRLEHMDRLAPSTTEEARSLLDRLLIATQRGFPAVSDLVREVRFHYFEQPVFEQMRNKVYEEMLAHLAYLAAHPNATDRDERMGILVACPQPMQKLLTSRFPESSDEMCQLMLEVLTRRYYRIPQLGPFEHMTVDEQALAMTSYDYDGKHIHAVTTFAAYASLGTAMKSISRFVAQLPSEHDIVADFYVWRPQPLGDSEAMEREIHTLIDQAGFPRLRRLVVVVVGPSHGLVMASTQHFTYRPDENGYYEVRVYRGLHPLMSRRLNLRRLKNFNIERLPSAEDVYLFRGAAKDNPKDERLFAFAEVRDMTPLRDELERIVQLPYLERMLTEALASIREYQSQLPIHKRLPWNRVVLYVWPPLGLPLHEFHGILQKLWPATEGLGLEKIVICIKITDASTGELRDRVLHISAPGGHEIVIQEDEPKVVPISTLSEFRQKGVQLRKRGLVYPYEILHMLTPASSGTHTQVPPGDFIEYDLDEHNQLVPVDRPYGKNKAGIVVGVIRNYTPKYPEGMTRVILLGDPSHSLGSVAEPECRRIREAINLAEQFHVPLEWFALSAGAKISMDSGTENMDWVARVLRRLIEFTQAGGEVNVIVNGINVGAQPYWNAGATMLMHTRGILIMTPDGAMVLTGKQSLDYSGGVSAEDNYGIGGYERVMGPNGQAQYFAPDLGAACHLLLRHYDYTYVMPGEHFPRRAETTDPITRDVRHFPYVSNRPEDSDLTCVGDLFSNEKNAERKRPFDIRTVLAAAIDADHQHLERWRDMHDADTVVVWDAYIGGYPVALLGIESHPIPRRGFIPADGPEYLTAATLFPHSAKKAARAINSASGNRPVVVMANLSGFDGSPESMRDLELEYGAEVGRAVTNFKGPIVFCVVSRYHGGSFVVFSKVLNENLEVIALEGSYASVIGGIPAAAVVFAHEVDARTRADHRVQALQEQLAQAEGAQKAALQIQLDEITALVRSEKVGEVASAFDHIHTVQRAQRVGSVDHVIPPAKLRPYLIETLERGMERELSSYRQ